MAPDLVAGAPAEAVPVVFAGYGTLILDLIYHDRQLIFDGEDAFVQRFTDAQGKFVGNFQDLQLL